jgi:hypothetical protein
MREYRGLETQPTKVGFVCVVAPQVEEVARDF